MQKSLNGNAVPRQQCLLRISACLSSILTLQNKPAFGKKYPSKNCSHVWSKRIIMRIKFTILILGICTIQTFARINAQVTATINIKNASLDKLLQQIKNQTGYDFFYNYGVVGEKIQISIKVKNMALNVILDSCLKQTPLSYKIYDNTIIITKKETPNIPFHLFSEQKQLLQQKLVKGKVTDSSGKPLGGVSIQVKGKLKGTITNHDGAFEINVDKGEILKFSYVGYITQEIEIDKDFELNIILNPKKSELNDLVITALGITRSKRSITYSTQVIGGEELSNSREINISSALNGKVAGLTINKTNSGPGSSNRIVFRGNRSIGRTNQPVLIVDGVRVDNSPKAEADVALFGGRDNGDGISNINPDDVESVTLLTGASAAALYGSDASNGAIVITTKKGNIGNGTSITIGSSAELSTPMQYLDLQNTYGQGDAGVFIAGSNNSWGPKMTGQQVEDWTGKTQSLVPQPNNFRDFFRTGNDLINSVTISSGSNKSRTYFSYTNNLSKGILPNNDFKRNNLNLRQTVDLYKGLTMDVKVNYILEDIINRPLTGAGNRIMSTLIAMPRSLRLNDIKNYETLNDDGSLTQNYWANETPSYQNPYWSAYRNLYDRSRKRFIGMASLKYQITPDLSIQARTSLDYYTDIGEEKDFNDSYWLSDYPGEGNYILNKESNKQFNNDLLISYNKHFLKSFSVNANVGASIERYDFERSTLNNQGLIAPNIFATSNAVALTNSVNNYIPYKPIERIEKQSIYASAELGYKNALFINLTGRNDWNSTLPVQNASYFFPSVGISAVLNELIPLPEIISTLKLRSSYAFVGNGTGFNEYNPSFSLVSGGNGGFLLIDNTLRNADLKPEETHSFEAGLDVGLFKERFKAGFTFYNTNTINQILSIPVPSPSGYSTRIINAGKIRNRGIELSVNGGIIASENFQWNVGIVFGANVNKVIRLDPLQQKVDLSSPQDLGAIEVEEGKKYGELYTASFERDSLGRIVVDENGKPLFNTDQKHYVGNYNPDWTGSISNTFSFKGWSLYVLIDERKGGTIISGTQSLATGNGTSKITEANRESGFIVPNSVFENGANNNKSITAQDYWTSIVQNAIGEPFAYSATNIRVREIDFGYTFPSSAFKHSFIKGCTLSLTGRNLFFIKNNAKGIDPESALGSGNNQGIEYASLPSTRNYGVYIKLNF
ncbi:MAG: SusC/RagA family TonB-linked outer membrane protein [Arachidicoccus sp.]|nr:SusC/RagA family TonB-linked outer membrane protein [Arachidicoccus sp.]